jgi:hypothetical protein
MRKNVTTQLDYRKKLLELPVTKWEPKKITLLLIILYLQILLDIEHPP